MAHEEKLPWDLIEEILSRVPPKSLVRFRTVCKQWNNLFNDKSFINNHKTTFQFVLTTKSKIYSVNVINPKIEVREITLDNNIPGLEESHIPQILVNCNEFLLCGSSICNLWLRQSRWILPHSMEFEGMGYDVKRACYKILVSQESMWRIYDFASDTWKDFENGDSTKKQDCFSYTTIDNSVSLDGSSHSLAFRNKTTKEEEEEGDRLCIVRFDFSKEKFSVFCELPREREHRCNDLVLGVFKGDRFSLLKQCFETKKIEILVTKNKVVNSKHVVWMSFMQVSIPNFPDLFEIESNSQPSYFIDDKRRFVVCFCDQTGRACIYVVGENKLISKARIDSMVDLWPSHCTYTPSLVPVPPSVEQEQVELQV